MFITKNMLEKLVTDRNLRPNKNLPPLMIYPKDGHKDNGK